MGIVYCVEHIDSGMSYVGQTQRRLLVRWNGHVATARWKAVSSFHKAVREFGASSFRVFELANAATRDELNKLEKMWILLLRSYDRSCGFNLTRGGMGHIPVTRKTGTRTGCKLTPDQLIRHGEIRKGMVPWNKGLRGVQTPWNKGLEASEETRNKQSLRKLGAEKFQCPYCELVMNKGNLSHHINRTHNQRLGANHA